MLDVLRFLFAENFAVYGIGKVWRQMMREGFLVARCTIERLMRDMGLQGVSGTSRFARRSATRQRRARWITSTAGSTRQRRTCCGCRISPTSQPGRASSTPPSS
jgi:hypothetical protein